MSVAWRGLAVQEEELCKSTSRSVAVALWRLKPSFARGNRAREGDAASVVGRSVYLAVGGIRRGRG